MALSSIISCDSCGRTQQLAGSGADVQSSWAILKIGQSKPRDVCPTCVARLGGWAWEDAVPKPRVHAVGAPQASHTAY